jgi:hypothetical protein
MPPIGFGVVRGSLWEGNIHDERAVVAELPPSTIGRDLNPSQSIAPLFREETVIVVIPVLSFSEIVCVAAFEANAFAEVGMVSANVVEILKDLADAGDVKISPRERSLGT